MRKNSLSTIEDLSNEQIEDVLELAGEMQKDLRACYGIASGYLMASLFLEPSTRTRGSFESAMKRLGGQTVTTADAATSSLAKGETLADTMRVWSGYADLIVMRHPWEGSARLSAEYATVPVVNAGDGGHEHPTQTLCDLLTLKKEHGALEGLRVALCGDLKNGRTVHSLTLALLRFGAQIIFVPGEGLDLPDYLKQRIVSEYGVPIERVSAKDMDLGALFDGGQGSDTAFFNAVYMTPTQPHQLAMHQQDALVKFASQGRPLALYMTRKQKEREGSGTPGAYPKVNARIMSSSSLSKAVVMHPLPRVDELATDMDQDPRSKYFEQAWNGVPVRMALISLILGLKPWRRAASPPDARPQLLISAQGLKCANPICVTTKEPQNAGPEVVYYPKPSPWFLCKYCERQVPAEYFLLSGETHSKPVQDLFIKSVDEFQRLRFFPDQKSASDAGFPPVPASRAHVIEVKG
jgi:aspartate carbamoyltransferase catalytic subunit